MCQHGNTFRKNSVIISHPSKRRERIRIAPVNQPVTLTILPIRAYGPETG
jgi:hypothetical protein